VSAAIDLALGHWRGLAARERALVGAGFAVLLLTLGQFAWHGGRAALAGLRADVRSQREALVIARELDAAGPTSAVSDQPLLALAERAARDVALGAALKRLDGGEGGRVRARLEAAPFGTLVRWLATVQAGSGATIDSIALQRGTAPGLVDADITLLPAGR